VIETTRLVLRRFRDCDLTPFAALNADPQVMQHMPKPLSRAESDAFGARIDAHFTAHGFGMFAVEVKGLAPFIGAVGLWKPSFEAPFMPCVEIGWRLARAHWGRGYVDEAARACLRFGFEQLGLQEVVSFTIRANTRSWRVMERLGMQRDAAGDFEHPSLPEGHPLRPHILYRIRREPAAR